MATCLYDDTIKVKMQMYLSMSSTPTHLQFFCKSSLRNAMSLIVCSCHVSCSCSTRPNKEHSRNIVPPRYQYFCKSVRLLLLLPVEMTTVAVVVDTTDIMWSGVEQQSTTELERLQERKGGYIYKDLRVQVSWRYF